MFKRKILIIIFGSIFIIGISIFSSFLKQHYLAPIITYHYVFPDPPPGDKLVLTPEAFQRQMRFLRGHRYNVIPLEALAKLISAKKKIPPRTVVITIDDGQLGYYVYILPILKKYNLPAAVFLNLRQVGPGQLTWDEVRQMRDSGLVSFGSHTLDHLDLTKVSPEELKRQICDSKKIIEAELKQPVTMFSYPYGAFNAEVKQAVIDAGYKLAVTTSPGENFPNDDIFVLKRIRISPNANNLFVFWFEISGIYTYLTEQKQKRKHRD